VTIVLSASNFINRKNLNVKTNDVFLLSGLLWLDADGARLYLGGALLQAWIKDGNEGLEIYNVYWLTSCEPNHNPCAPSKLGAKITIRPVPEHYQYCREPF
jgi:hypothetical protein